jgi:uncharacterized integral membrane protein
MGLLQAASKTALRISVLFLLLLAFSMANLDPNSSSYVTAQLTLIPVMLTLAGSIVVIYTGWEPFT